MGKPSPSTSGAGWIVVVKNYSLRQNFYSIQPVSNDIEYSLSMRGGGKAASEILPTEQDAINLLLQLEALDEVQNS